MNIAVIAASVGGNGLSAPYGSQSGFKADRIPVLGYHQVDIHSAYSVWSKNFALQMKLLKDLGYSTISPAQYLAWMYGEEVDLPLKPILITFDDGFVNVLGLTHILQRYGFRAVMFAVSGFADSKNPYFMNWQQLESIRDAGWYIQLHAGPSGHKEFRQKCKHFLGCRQPGEAIDHYRERVMNDLDEGEKALAAHGLLEGNKTSILALPFADEGIRGGDTDIASWFPQYLSERFRCILHQANYRKGFNRRFRYEVHMQTTLAELRKALIDKRFMLK